MKRAILVEPHARPKGGIGHARTIVSVGLGVGLACIPPEPPKSKKEEPPCIVEPDNQALVVATIGDKHLSTNGYALSRLGDAMDAFRPDMVLVDLPSRVLKGDRQVEAPLELAYITYAAGSRSSEVFAIGDSRADLPVASKPDTEDEAALAKETVSLSDLDAPTFEDLNGPEGTRKIAIALNARARYAKGDPDWARHEAWIEHQADGALDVKKPRRVLLFTAPLYRGALEAHLRTRGYAVKDPVTILHRAKEERESTSVPDVVVNAWRSQEAELDQEAISSHPGHDHAWLEWRIAVLKLAVIKQGGCCVSADEVPPAPKAPPPPPPPLPKKK